ncbi:unnamed protein product [Coffea canephora]|uniref:Uncharacterized protein n=1 Tax=Coffea canephora TaxID=49390 RepID=A0A068VA53_COFCA|nr:unnamed protein product [Coffea canephora]
MAVKTLNNIWIRRGPSGKLKPWHIRMMDLSTTILLRSRKHCTGLCLMETPSLHFQLLVMLLHLTPLISSSNKLSSYSIDLTALLTIYHLGFGLA